MNETRDKLINELITIYKKCTITEKQLAPKKNLYELLFDALSKNDTNKIQMYILACDSYIKSDSLDFNISVIAVIVTIYSMIFQVNESIIKIKYNFFNFDGKLLIYISLNINFKLFLFIFLIVFLTFGFIFKHIKKRKIIEIREILELINKQKLK